MMLAKIGMKEAIQWWVANMGWILPAVMAAFFLIRFRPGFLKKKKIVPQKPQAWEPYQKEADGGSAQAQLLVAREYELAGKSAQATEWYQKAATKVTPRDYYQLGLRRRTYSETEKANLHEAVRWFTMARTQGVVEASYELANLFSAIGSWWSASGTERAHLLKEAGYSGEAADKKTDWQQCSDLYKEAAGKGHTRAQEDLEAFYTSMLDNDKSLGPVDRTDWLVAAVAQTDNVAEYLLAAKYYRGDGTASDDGKYLHWLAVAGGHLHLAAQLELGEQLEKLKKYSEAIIWYRMAAEAGAVKAQYALARFLSEGLGTVKNKDEAIQWLNKALATDPKFAPALTLLATLSLSAPDADPTKALELYLIPAKQGDREAQYNVAVIYESKQDYEHAATWYTQAIARTTTHLEFEMNAHFNLGLLYDKGLGVSQDREKAQHQYFESIGFGAQSESEEDIAIFNRIVERAFAQDDSCVGLQYVLGIMYEYGRSIPKDRDEAVRRLRRSAAKGNTDAKGQLAYLGETE